MQQIDSIAVLSTLERMRRSVVGIEHRGLPCHYLDYGEAVTKPLVFTRVLAASLHLEADEDRIQYAAGWIKPGGYNDA
jgi:hypothetical protein